MSCKLSLLETVCIKCQSLFSGGKKNKKKISICHVVKSFIPECLVLNCCYSNPSPKPKPKKPVIDTAPASTSAAPLDLLGSIMQDQNKLHMQSKDITIQKDGEYQCWRYSLFLFLHQDLQCWYSLKLPHREVILMRSINTHFVYIARVKTLFYFSNKK